VRHGCHTDATSGLAAQGVADRRELAPSLFWTRVSAASTGTGRAVSHLPVTASSRLYLQRCSTNVASPFLQAEARSRRLSGIQGG
jgi:hypothetical protein